MTTRWGYRGQGGVVMPGQGRTEFHNLPQNQPSLGEKAVIGSITVDVFLNEFGSWKGIPVEVWEYTLGGYQVLKKWLSYRQKEVLGRALKVEEIREFTNIARRIAAIIALHPDLDATMSRVKRAQVNDARHLSR